MPENVIVSAGAKQSIMVLLHAILDPKEEVIFPVPYWVSFPEMVKIAGDRHATAVSNPPWKKWPKPLARIPRPSF